MQETLKIKIRELRKIIEEVPTLDIRGKILNASGLKILASVPDGRIGDLVEIISEKGTVVRAEIIGFEGNYVILSPLDEISGISPRDIVRKKNKPILVPCGEGIVGKVIDAFGNPLPGNEVPNDVEWRDINSPPPNPLTRKRIIHPLSLGIKVIDGLLTVGQGQRIGLFAGSGVGKSTLIGQISRNTEAEIVVIGLIGERGREVREFIEDCLGQSGMKKSVVVCSTSDAPAVARFKAVLTATTIAEWFRETGGKVLLLIDSLTRAARALKEIGIAGGEPAGRRGYPASTFATLSRVLERAGNSDKGIMTAIYTILVEGDDMDEPVADETRGILDGHIVLNRRLAERGIRPPVDILQSVSRVMGNIVSKEHLEAARWMTSVISTYQNNSDLINLGLYKKGSDKQIDHAIFWIKEIENFIKQDKNEIVPLNETVKILKTLWQKATSE